MRNRAFFCLLLAAAVGRAQTGLSTIRGTVSDASGAVVAECAVEAVDVLTNIRRVTVSNAAGNYELPELKPGSYRLRVQMAGFKTHVADGILLESNVIRRLDVSLEIGDTSATVNVEASPGVIDLEEAKVASAVSNQNYNPQNPYVAEFTQLMSGKRARVVTLGPGQMHTYVQSP